MKRIIFILCIFILCILSSLHLFAQDEVADSMSIQKAIDACISLRDAVEANDKESIEKSSWALKSCGVKDFSSLHCEDDSIGSLNGHLVFNDIFADLYVLESQKIYKISDEIVMYSHKSRSKSLLYDILINHWEEFDLSPLGLKKKRLKSKMEEAGIEKTVLKRIFSSKDVNIDSLQAVIESAPKVKTSKPESISEQPVRGQSANGTILTKTCFVKAGKSTKYTFTSRGHQELAVVAEAGGLVTMKIHVTNNVGLDKRYDDTKNVRKGEPHRKTSFELPTDCKNLVELEIVNCCEKDCSFVVISN